MNQARFEEKPVGLGFALSNSLEMKNSIIYFDQHWAGGERRCKTRNINARIAVLHSWYTKKRNEHRDDPVAKARQCPRKKYSLLSGGQAGRPTSCEHGPTLLDGVGGLFLFPIHFLYSKPR
jgi:hypothetical protein